MPGEADIEARAHRVIGGKAGEDLGNGATCRRQGAGRGAG